MNEQLYCPHFFYRKDQKKLQDLIQRKERGSIIVNDNHMASDNAEEDKKNLRRNFFCKNFFVPLRLKAEITDIFTLKF